MNRISFVLIAAVALATVCVAAEEELYSDKYDYIDPREIVNNDRLREQYLRCFMDTGPCITPDAIFVKEHLPEAVVTKCRKCTQKQKEGFAFLVEWFHDNKPDDWNALLQKMVEHAKEMHIAD